MPKRAITQERLARAGDDAAERAMKDMAKILKTETVEKLICTYLGTAEEDAPLHTRTRVKFHWKIDGIGGVDSDNIISKVLHCDYMAAPCTVKIPFLVACLPLAITTHRSLPAMLKYPKGDAVCRALGVARPHEADCQTTFVNVGGRRVEHLMCAHVSGETWLLHPGDILSPKDLFKSEVRQDAAKKARLTAPTQKLEPVRPSDQLNKLMAVAHFRAEIERARVAEREVDLNVADECFEKNPFEWRRAPRQAFVIWSSKSAEGGWEHRVDEANFASLSKRV